MNTINDRIQNIVDEHFNGNISAFGRASGIPQATLSSILGNRRSKPTFDVLNLIVSAKSLNISPEWLMTGNGRMTIPPSKKNTDMDNIYNNITMLPLIPYTAAGGLLTHEIPGVKIEECEQYAIPDFAARGADFLVRVSGDSMAPRYSNGDILAVKVITDASFIQWGSVHVIDTIQGLVVKRLLPAATPDSVTCRSESSANYPDYTIPRTDIRGLALVIGAIKIE